MSNKGRISRRDFLAVGAAGSVLMAAQGIRSGPNGKTSELTLYVGTYTSDTKSEGIYVCGFDPKSGKITLRHTVKNVVDPSFLTIDKSNRYLYAVNELVEYDGRPSGAVSAFSIDQATGDLKFLNKLPSMGGAPCHITVSANGKYVLVANYVGGNVSCFPVEKDGRLGPSVDLVQHTGSGPNKDRQLTPHAHSINLDRRNRYAFAADLGIDRIMIYRFDSGTGKLTPNPAQPYFQTKPGSGPRHFAFHPNGKLAFVISELDSSITSLWYDPNAGTLKEIRTVSTLSPDFKGVSACADIHVSPDGRFLYGSNRGEDSIAVFAIDETTGNITNIENTPTGGKRPRNFAIDPTGAFLLAANQDSGNIVVSRIDKRSGKLTRTEYSLKIPSPVCLKLVPATA